MLGVSYGKNSIGGLMLGFFIMTVYGLASRCQCVDTEFLCCCEWERCILAHDVF